MCLNSTQIRRSILQVLHFGAAGLVAGSLVAAPIFPRATSNFSYSDSLPTLENSSSTLNAATDADWKGKLPISDFDGR